MAYQFTGPQRAYVPDLGRWVDPGEVVDFPQPPNSPYFTEATGQPAPSQPEPQPEPEPASEPADADTTNQEQ